MFFVSGIVCVGVSGQNVCFVSGVLCGGVRGRLCVL